MFFLLVAFFFIPASQAEDLGPYGNYSGTCSLRPLNAITPHNMMCIPNKANVFQLGDTFNIIGVNPADRNYRWTLNLLSSTYEVLYHASIKPRCGEIFLDRNVAPWASGRWKTKGEYFQYFPRAKFEGDTWIRLINTPKGIALEVDYYGWMYDCQRITQTFTYPHLTSNPASDYKYFMISKPTTLNIGSVFYRSHLAPESSYDDNIEFTDNIWNIAPANWKI